MNKSHATPITRALSEDPTDASRPSLWPWIVVVIGFIFIMLCLAGTAWVASLRMAGVTEVDIAQGDMSNGTEQLAVAATVPPSATLRVP